MAERKDLRMVEKKVWKLVVSRADWRVVVRVVQTAVRLVAVMAALRVE